MTDNENVFRMLDIFLLLCAFFLSLSLVSADLITDQLLYENDFILTKDPLNATAWEYRSLIFFNAGNYQEAIGAAQKTLTINPESEFAWHIIGTSWGNLGYYDKADEAFDKSLFLGSSDPGQWNKKGVAQSKLKQYNEAITSFMAALEIDPQYAVAWNNLGVTQYNSGQYDDAITSFEKAYQIDSDESLFMSNKAQTYLRKGDLDSAEIITRLITVKDPGCVPGWFVNAEVNFLKKNYNNAYYSYEHGFRSFEKDNTWYYAGVKNIKITKDMDAVTSYYESVASNINITDSWDKTIIIDYKLRRYNDTLISYDQLMVIEPDYKQAKEQQAISALNTERYDTAQSLFQNILTDKPQDSLVLAGQALASAHLGDYLGSLNKTDEALNFNSESAYVWSIKGDIYALYAQFDDSIQSYDRSLAIERTNDVLLSLSDVQFRKGDYLGSIVNHLRGTLGI